jgi:kynurenine formamidase
MATNTFMDLSHILEMDMPVYPGSKPAVITKVSSLTGEGFNELSLQISTHSGTHVDCGHHMLAGGSNTLTTAVDHFFGSGLVIDCRQVGAGRIITREHLQRHEHLIRVSEFILFHTGWSQFWGLPRYFDSFPVMSVEAAKYLTGFNLKGLGCDTPGFDPVESADFPVHSIILSAGMILVENLVNLDCLPETAFIFSCFPLRIKDGDGSPVRAVGIVMSNK